MVGKRRTVGKAGVGGALRGRSPRTREGRIGPTAQKSGERVKRSEERENFARVVQGCDTTVAE